MLNKYLLLAVMLSIITIQGMEYLVVVTYISKPEDIVKKIPPSGDYELDLVNFSDQLKRSDEKVKILNEAFSKLSPEQAKNLKKLDLVKALGLDKDPDLSRFKNIKISKR
jgi:hypothetical protein